MKPIAPLAIAGLVLCAAPLAGAQELIQGYTCCNLHYDKDWINDSSKRATVEIDGKTLRIGQDYGKDEPLEQFISKLVVKTPPKAKIDRYPEPVRAAIHAGKVIPGMTREQVIIAVSYPPTHRTPTLDSPVWHHWQSRAGRFEIRWDEHGKVREVVGQK
jgi:hypothetical protein